ncbi:MAG TPA: MOSC domain-containing protein [Vicinamibacterales bacterium]|nr:MOSC domain-containing protein [Vicinamibacterales bacterium]
MQVLSVNVGLPREVVVDGRRVLTSIFKAPVSGRIAVRAHNLAGDQQSDLSVHGGPAKAVYAYPHEHYAFWREELPGVDLQPGNFGENLTVVGLLEADAHIGDRLRVGTAELVVTQPRLPCYKLGIRFGRADMVKRFHKSGRSGFYLAVHVAGDVAERDTIEVLERNPAAVSIAELLRLYFDDNADVARLQQVAAIPALPDTWRDELEARVTAS